jgi:multimeric flavodoxin WrbA
MKVLAINGSPRKTWNTAMLLEQALAGAASQGANTAIIHLYELNYKGCLSCFACKKRNGKNYGNCAVEDDLAPIFAEIKTSAALILGSPIYFGDVTGAMRSFMERLLFPCLVYSLPRQTLFPGNIRTGLIYTMNAPAEEAQRFGYDRLFKANERIMKMIFGHAESFMSYDTYQFEDYSKVVADGIDHERKKKRRQEIFPSDCRKAFEMGARLLQLSAS